MTLKIDVWKRFSWKWSKDQILSWIYQQLLFFHLWMNYDAFDDLPFFCILTTKLVELSYNFSEFFSFIYDSALTTAKFYLMYANLQAYYTYIMPFSVFHCWTTSLSYTLIMYHDGFINMYIHVHVHPMYLHFMLCSLNRNHCFNRIDIVLPLRACCFRFSQVYKSKYCPVFPLEPTIIPHHGLIIHFHTLLLARKL